MILLCSRPANLPPVVTYLKQVWQFVYAIAYYKFRSKLIILVMEKNQADILSYLNENCPLCLSTFDDETHIPMMLCHNQHLACKVCFDDNFKKKAGLTCPACRTPIDHSKVTIFRMLYKIIQEMKEPKINVGKLLVQQQEKPNRECNELDLNTTQNLESTQKKYQPSNLEALTTRAVVYFKKGSINKCIDLCKMIIQKNPQQQGQYLGLGSKEEQFGFYQGRVIEWFTERFYGKKICPYDLLGLCFLIEGNFQRQRQWYTKMSQIHPTNWKILYGMAVNYHNQGDLAEAQKIYIKITEIEPIFCKSYQMLGFIGLTLKKTKKYKYHIEKCLELDRNNIYGKYLIASYYLNAKAYKKCQQQTNQISTLQPKYVRALCLQGRSYLYRLNYESALDCFEEGIRINPKYDICLFHEGQALMEMKQYYIAIEVLLQYFKCNSLHTQCLFLLGKAYIKQGDYYSAQIYLLKLREINPSHRNACKLLANAYLRRQSYRQAVKMYKQGFELSPNSEQTLEKIIYCYQQLGDRLGIVIWTQKLLQINPKDDIHLKIAKAQFKRKQYSGALRKYEQCLKLNLPKSDIYEDMVEIYAIRKNFEEVLEKSKDWLLVQADSDKVLKKLYWIFNDAQNYSALQYTTYE